MCVCVAGQKGERKREEEASNEKTPHYKIQPIIERGPLDSVCDYVREW